MTRRRETSLADALLDIVARLPWWAGVALAVILYLTLHEIAGQQVVISATPGQMGGTAVRSLGVALASFGQYLLPAVCLFGAVASAMASRKRQGLIAGVSASNAANPLDSMSWREFEMLIGEAFRMQGYRVTETGGGGADGGVDLVLTRDREMHLVQCKQWKAYKVGVTVVRELYGVMTARSAAGGLIVTSGRFTQEAAAFASQCGVRLIEGPELVQLIRQAQAARPSSVFKAVAPEPPATRTAATTRSTPAASAPPSCPRCGDRMVRRTAKRGSNAGGDFWGCGTWPNCRGVRSVS